MFLASETRCLRAAGLAAVAALAPVAAAATEGTTREWRFEVSLDGRPIGEHRYQLRDFGDLRELTSEARFRVRVLMFDMYRYEHVARESWRGDCLEEIDARTVVNGRRTAVAGGIESGKFQLTPSLADTLLDDCVQTFAYWNPGILNARQLLNPQTGEYVPVQVRELGREMIAEQPADRFRLSGGGRTPLEIELWYTPSRDWLALESRTPEGRRLRYERK